jgi:hypothetical protein
MYSEIKIKYIKTDLHLPNETIEFTSKSNGLRIQNGVDKIDVVKYGHIEITIPKIKIFSITSKF